MKYIATIGLEVHVQLCTKSKMFCGCSTDFGASPNTHICPVCLGYPGAMPSANKEAVRLTVMTGLMIGSKISSFSKFDRKSYFYPDMPKNYQISQYDKPLCVGGIVEINIEGVRRPVHVTRIHLEEDVAKNMHFKEMSGIDFNRAGVPLMEIVSEPDLASPEEAFAYLVALKQILQYAGVSNCNLEEGNIRCDVNCSIRPEGQEKLGTKTELKNLNTFKGVLNALKYEIPRQISVVEGGGKIIQETRRWDMDTGVTTSMRTKEYAHDYRYFPEPDLLPIVFADEQILEWKSRLPEMPVARRDRFISQYGLPEYDAGVLVADKAVSHYFEEVVGLCGRPKAASNWIMTEMLRMLSESEREITSVLISPRGLADLVILADDGIINSNTAKAIFAELFVKGGDPIAIVKDRNLAQVSDSGIINGFVDQAINENPKSVADFIGGKDVASKFLVGQVMKLSKGKADPKLVLDLIVTKLRSR